MWNRTVYTMRVLCPLMIVACSIVGYAAWRNGSCLLLAANAFLAGFNVVLTWVQWNVFQPRR